MSMGGELKSPLGVCVLPEAGPNAPRTVSYPAYVHEILAHAGLCYTPVAADGLIAALVDLRVLVTIGEMALDDDTKSAIRKWIRNGGAWISVAGVCGMGDVLGVEPEPPTYSFFGGGLGTLGEGYLKPCAKHPILAHLNIPLHYFNGMPVRVTKGKSLATALDAHQRPTGRAALVERRVGNGRCIFIACDIAGTATRIQQGVAITRDGVSASDGTASVADCVLKSDDGQVLDWHFDRSPVKGVPGFKAFLNPIADQWRELLLRSIFHVCTKQRVSLPVLWLYPRNLPALAVMSHDSDGNDADRARKLIKVLAKAGIKSTWCVMCPGYPSEVIGEIRAAGHELAMHFDAISEGTEFTESEFVKQLTHLKNLLGENPVTNKNHYLRWEGDDEFFLWCERHGIEFDQTKGPSKTGTAGFGFGSCHPHFPIDRVGEIINVLELPTITQDLMVFAPRELSKPLADAAAKSHGIFHLLFHPAHMARPDVPKALLYSVKIARKLGMEWWPARRINEWERARYKAKWTGWEKTKNGVRVSLETGDALPGATILWLGGGSCMVNGRKSKSRVVKRWGFAFDSIVVDAKAQGELTFDCKSSF